MEQDFPYCFHRVCCNAPLSHSVCVRGAIHWSVRPLVSLNNGKVVLLEVNHGEFLLYDLEKKKSKEISIRRPRTEFPFGLYTYSSYIYQESLV